MAWMDFGEPPQGIGSIERTDFRHVSVFKRIATTIGICIMSITGVFFAYSRVISCCMCVYFKPCR